MHKKAANCTYIEEKAHFSPKELDEMYQQAYRNGYLDAVEAESRKQRRQSKASFEKTRDFRQILAK